MGLALQSWALVGPRSPCLLVLASFWLHGLSEGHTPKPQMGQALLFFLDLWWVIHGLDRAFNSFFGIDVYFVVCGMGFIVLLL